MLYIHAYLKGQQDHTDLFSSKDFVAQIVIVEN